MGLGTHLNSHQTVAHYFQHLSVEKHCMLLSLLLTQEMGTEAQIEAMSRISKSECVSQGSMSQSWELIGLVQDLGLVRYSGLRKTLDLLKSASSSIRRFCQEEVCDIRA